MGSGYVLDFSNRTFQEFVEDYTGRDIYNARYDLGSGSKANRLRGFWNEEPNHLVAKLMSALLDHGTEIGAFKPDDEQLLAACRQTINRLSQDTPVADIDALTPNADERDFEAVAKQAQEAILRNQPETGLVDCTHSLSSTCGAFVNSAGSPSAAISPCIVCLASTSRLSEYKGKSSP